MARELLNKGERARIAEAVASAERRTCGEIVPVVLRASDTYPGARWRLSVAFAVAVGALGVWLAPQIEPLWLVLAELPALALGHLFAARPALLRHFLRRAKVAEEVRQRAIELFFELGLHTTRERTGVLILISLLEHRIEILADTGIDEKTPKGFWDDVTQHLAERIRQGALVDGLVDAIGRCGDLLAEQFPARADDVNELANEVVVQDR